MAVQETGKICQQKSDFTFVTVIVCNKNLKTNRISHSRWWFSHQGWIANKEDQWRSRFNSSDQNKEIGNKLCILIGNCKEFSQFLDLRMDFLFE